MADSSQPKHSVQGTNLADRYGRPNLSVKNTFLNVGDEQSLLDNSLDASCSSAPAQLNHLSLDDSGSITLSQTSPSATKPVSAVGDRTQDLSLDDSIVSLVSQRSLGGSQPLSAVAEEGPIEPLEPVITTMQIRNIPNRCTKDEVVRHVDELGFVNQYNLFHMPLDRKRKSNLGYAFINFLEPETALMFQKTMKGTCVTGDRVQQNCRKACTVAPAAVQGLENYIRNLVECGKELDTLIVFEGMNAGMEQNVVEASKHMYHVGTKISL